MNINAGDILPFVGWVVSDSDGFGRENINMFDLVWLVVLELELGCSIGHVLLPVGEYDEQALTQI